MTRSLVLPFLLWLVLSGHLLADRIPPLYQFREIPVPEDYHPGRTAGVSAINDAGQVCGVVGLEVESGSDLPSDRGYFWDSRENHLIMIHNLYGRGVNFPHPRGNLSGTEDAAPIAVSTPEDINAHGNLAVLDWLDDDNQGFFWSDFDGDGVDDDNDGILLPTFDYRNDSWAQNGRTFVRGLNDLNQVVGASSVANPDGSRKGEHAFIWEDTNGNRVAEESEMINLGVFGTDISSRAVRINNSGMIMGIGSTSGGGLRGIIFEPHPVDGYENPLVSDIGTLGKNRVTPHDLNEGGIIVGEAQSSVDNQNHGFVWDETNGMRDLNSLPLQGFETGWLIATAQGINDHNVIVGNFVDDEDNFRPFIIDLDALTFAPLDDLVPPPPDHSRYGAVKGINNLGQIVGVRFPNSTWIRSYVLTPIDDTDSDGLVDIWEEWELGGTAAYEGGDNPDGDSFTLEQEMLMALDPLSFDPPPVVDIATLNQEQWLTLTYRETTLTTWAASTVKESTSLQNFQGYPPDGTTRKLEVIDSDPDGTGSAVLKRYSRKIQDDETALFLRLEFIAN